MLCAVGIATRLFPVNLERFVRLLVAMTANMSRQKSVTMAPIGGGSISAILPMVVRSNAKMESLRRSGVRSGRTGEMSFGTKEIRYENGRY